MKILSHKIKSFLEVEDLVERDAIPDRFRVEGFVQVYVKSDLTIYHLAGGITNSHWQSSGGGSGDYPTEVVIVPGSYIKPVYAESRIILYRLRDEDGGATFRIVGADADGTTIIIRTEMAAYDLIPDGVSIYGMDSMAIDRLYLPAQRTCELVCSEGVWWVKQDPMTGFLSGLFDVNAGRWYDDWYVPSRDECLLIHTELMDTGILPNMNIWTSSEVSATNAYYINTGGSAISALKASATYMARPVRAFTSSYGYNVRERGPAGGWIIYRNGVNYIEAAPFYLGSMYRWCNPEIATQLIGTSTAIGTGLSNTNAVVAFAGSTWGVHQEVLSRRNQEDPQEGQILKYIDGAWTAIDDTPSLTTTERVALNPSRFMMVFDTTLSTLFYFNGTSWIEI